MRISAVSGWRGVTLIAITYVYFLIFAQFAFLSRLAELGMAGISLKVVLAAMAVGGVLASLLAPGLAPIASHATGVRIGLSLCGVSAFASLLPLNIVAAGCVAFLIGAGLGLLTVTLVTHLRDWTGAPHALGKVGLGTGLGYFLCNVPWLFAATPGQQAIVAAIICAIGLWAAGNPLPAAAEATGPADRMSFATVLASFAALVWLDSAAFYIIQHAPALKAGTWLGAAHLWTNAFIHLGAAVASAFLLSRKGIAFVLAAAFLVLGAACILLANPSHTLQASLLYPAGVSLYSVALVAYPSFLTTAFSPAQRGRQAGLIYAIAGWIGSALGIGMGQNLGHVPLLFVVFAGLVVLGPALFRLVQARRREVVAVTGLAFIAFALNRVTAAHSSETDSSPVERGRKLYISEGCINCHSQYVRPNTSDVLLWGPAGNLRQIHLQKPPLIGNRRQGPDLSQVGTRRSPLWLKAHLVDPAEISGRSIMPSYAFLFGDQRGNDLVAYLVSLHTGDASQHIAGQQSWMPSPAAANRANASEGAQVYRAFCATCHEPDGATRRKWATSFKTLPADLRTGPFRYVRETDPAARRLRIAQIGKFGIPGTDMPGHEYLNDEQIAALSLWLTQPQTQANLQK
jgi:cytochrome c oxidase cbb3-type subunit 2